MSDQPATVEPTDEPMPTPAWPGTEPETPEGPNLVAIVLDDPLQAPEALLAAMRMVQRNRLELEDAALVAKEGDKVKVQETKDMTTGQGAWSGGFWGLLGGTLLAGGPIGLAIGAAGAAAGGIFAKLRDIGIQDEQMQELGDQLEDGEVAVLLLIASAHPFHARNELGRFSGRLLHTTCDADGEALIRDSLAHDPYARPVDLG